MNIFVRGLDSYEGYQTQILNKVFEKIDCKKCVIVTRNYDGKDQYGENYVVYSYMEIDYKKHYYDLNTMSSIPEDILLKMQKYEGKIFELEMRESGFPVHTFLECKEMYYEELIFWYNVIIKNKIEYMIFHNAPHELHDFVIYCLGQVMNIPTILFMPTFFPGRLEWGNSYPNLGLNVGKKYKRLLQEGITVNLETDLNDLYETYRNGLKKQQFSEFNENNKEMIKKYEADRLAFVKGKAVRDRRNVLLYKVIKEREKTKRFHLLQELLWDIELTKRSKKYLKKAILVNKYNKYDAPPRLEEKGKYIYFALQKVPESNLMPKIEAFYEQRFSIFVLAKSAEKYGITLYVKEHWIQDAREKEFYDFIKSFSNVRLIGMDESNLELIKNSLAVATASGSCIFEAMFNGLPSITFGDGYWIEAPGCYRVHDEDSCCNALEHILRKEYEITDYNIKTYLKAVEEETVKMNIYQKSKYGSKLTDDECVESISKFLINQLEDYKNV